jgi:hypothetical protein
MSNTKDCPPVRGIVRIKQGRFAGRLGVVLRKTKDQYLIEVPTSGRTWIREAEFILVAVQYQDDFEFYTRVWGNLKPRLSKPTNTTSLIRRLEGR